MEGPSAGNGSTRRCGWVCRSAGSALLFSLAVIGTAYGQIDTLDLTIENIYRGRHRATQSALSPDGRFVAVSANGPDGSGIYLILTDDPAGTGSLWVRGRSAAWFPDSRHIVFQAEGDLWSIAIGDDRPVRLTETPDDERAARVAPDGQTIAFYSRRSGAQDIWTVPATGGTARQLTFDAYAIDESRWAPAWSPDSRRIAYISNAADFWADDVFVVDIATRTPRQVSRRIMASSTPAWSPDGSRIALMATFKSGYWYEDLAEIVVLVPEEGTELGIEMHVKATDWLHSMPLFWSGDGARIFFPYQERGDFNLWAVPSRGGVATRVTNMEGSIRSLTATAAADAFAFIRTLPTRGPDVDYVPATGGTLRQLTRFADAWSTVIDPVEVSYVSHDGLYIQGFLYRPPGPVPDGGFPALVHVHGGGTNSYLHSEGLFEQYLASKGYVVLAVNYRGGSGFGRAFQDLGVNDWANGQARDAAAAAGWLRAQPFSNGKVGIYGYSYGGITSMAAIARAPGVFDAAVPMAGIYDFADAFTNADRIGRIFIKTGHGGTPDERPEVYAISNTLARVDRINTPLLVMHGEEDVRAPYRQFQLVVDRLRTLGKTFESRSYPGEPHGLSAAARIDMYRRAEAFLDRWLKVP